MKEVIFHFFPSVRFLGLGLKILFHKNKEIKRMLSKKMTFSLMSLITLLAFAFITVPVMAADEITTTLTYDSNVRGSDITVTITFGAVVGRANGILVVPTVIVTDENGLEANALTVTVAQKDIDADTLLNQFDGKTFMFTIPASATAGGVVAKSIYIHVAKGVKAADLNSADLSAAAAATITLIAPGVADPDAPTVVSITRAVPVGSTLASAFIAQVVSGTFQVKIVLSEQPKAFAAANLAVSGAVAVVDADIVAGVAFAASDTPVVPPLSEGGYTTSDTVPGPTSDDEKYYPYLVSITPDGTADMVIVKVAEFENNDPAGFSAATGHFVSSKKYITPPDAILDSQPNGRQRLTVAVTKDATALAAGHEVLLTNKRVAPAGGYLIVATDPAMTGINLPTNADADDNAPKAEERSPAEMKYNAIKVGLPNLEAFLANGGTIDLVSPAAGLVISEIMWGSDASLLVNSNSQWIEIKNTTAANIATGDKTHKLIFYGPNETLPDMSVAANNIQDRVGTIGAGGYWSLAGKGQSGRTGAGEAKTDLTAVVPTQPIISMQRTIDATGVGADGTMASSWTQSTPPAVNFAPAAGPNRIASPGDESATYPVAPVVVAPVVAPTVPVAMPEDIMISEIMVDTGGGRLPQWIELTNVSGAEVSLAGWSLMITNSDADDDVVGSLVSIDLSGTLGVGGGEDAGGTMGKSLLLVAGNARSSSNLVGSDRVVDISDQVDQKGRYTLISTMGFMAALIPPQTTGILTYGDIAGNLEDGWELPASEGGRSSLIRREMDTAGMATMGTMANGWVLASSTALVSGPATWYGSDEDAGTPGYDAGGPLPVQLSHFRPARDRDTGAAVITWSTQSELNNAGFFIKRSQQRDGQFKVINAAMIQGAGTISEKQFYTYTDTTAQPNVVYYYQIEDVSLDGNRQTLTNGIRLKGHIGAAGKLTTTWGDLKTSQ